MDSKSSNTRRSYNIKKIDKRIVRMLSNIALLSKHPSGFSISKFQLRGWEKFMKSMASRCLLKVGIESLYFCPLWVIIKQLLYILYLFSVIFDQFLLYLLILSIDKQFFNIFFIFPSTFHCNVLLSWILWKSP